MTESTSPSLPSPSLWRRLAAILYDSLLVLALIVGVMFVVVPIYGAIAGQADQESVVRLDRRLVWLVCWLTPTAFFTIFWMKSGQTLSMQAWRIKLQGFNGDLPTLGQALIRCLAAPVSALCLGAGYWWCLFDPRGRYWHDYLSGTELVLLPGKADKKQKQDKKKKKKTG